MFERYTEKARRVIFFARYEASHFGSPYIEAEHMLLGLLREDKSLFPAAIAAALNAEIRGSIPQNEKTATSVDLPLSHFSKQSLALGAEEAERLHHRHIGTVHLLLGLMHTESNVVSILNRHGFTLENLRARFAEKERPRSTQAGSAQSVNSLRDQFAPLTRRLTHEIEPALVYLLSEPAE